MRTARLGAAVGDDDVDETLFLLLDDFARGQQLELDDLADRLADLLPPRLGGKASGVPSSRHAMNYM